MSDHHALIEEPPPPIHDDYGVSDQEWLEIDWTDLLREITIKSELGSTPISYVEMGEGRPVLFVHGLGGSWRNWVENIPWFARRHRVVALDLPGFGLSPAPEEPISMHAYGDLVVKFADAIGLPRDTALVGHSMGGFIATESVINSPGHFNSLTLASAAGITFATMRDARKSVTSALMRLMMPIAANRMEQSLGRQRLRTASFAGVIAHPGMIGKEVLWELGSYAVNSPSLLEAAYALAGYDTRDRLAEISIPTLIIWGQQDRLVPVRAAYAYAERIPGSELSLVHDCGHMVQMERPARFNSELSLFIDAVDEQVKSDSFGPENRPAD